MPVGTQIKFPDGAGRRACSGGLCTWSIQVIPSQGGSLSPSGSIAVFELLRRTCGPRRDGLSFVAVVLAREGARKCRGWVASLPARVALFRNLHVLYAVMFA
jgi:hypothetical protein